MEYPVLQLPTLPVSIDATFPQPAKAGGRVRKPLPFPHCPAMQHHLLEQGQESTRKV